MHATNGYKPPMRWYQQHFYSGSSKSHLRWLSGLQAPLRPTSMNSRNMLLRRHHVKLVSSWYGTRDYAREATWYAGHVLSTFYTFRSTKHTFSAPAHDQKSQIR